MGRAGRIFSIKTLIEKYSNYTYQQKEESSMSRATYSIYDSNETKSVKKTIIVLGCPRGGTSMAAGICRLLGVNMGSVGHNQEDPDFLQHGGLKTLQREKNDEERKEVVNTIRELVLKRNQQLDVWGWKDPLASFYIQDLSDLLINPRLICIYRDAASIAAGEMRFMKNNVQDPLFSEKKFYVEIMNRIINQQKDIIEFTLRSNLPLLNISYEKALLHPEDTIDSLSAFVGLERYDGELGKSEIISYISAERRYSGIPGDEANKT